VEMKPSLWYQDRRKSGALALSATAGNMDDYANISSNPFLPAIAIGFD